MTVQRGSHFIKDGCAASFEECAQALGVSHQRAHQIYAVALRKLRAMGMTVEMVALLQLVAEKRRLIDKREASMLENDIDAGVDI